MSDQLAGGAPSTAPSSRYRASSGGVPTTRPPSDSPPPHRSSRTHHHHHQHRHGRASSEISGSRQKYPPQTSGVASPGVNAPSTSGSTNPSKIPAADASTALPCATNGNGTSRNESTVSQTSSSTTANRHTHRSSHGTPRLSYHRSSTAPSISTTSSSKRSSHDKKSRRTSSGKGGDGAAASTVTASETSALKTNVSAVADGISKTKHKSDPTSAADHVGGSFLIMDDDQESVYRSSDDIPILDREIDEGSARSSRNAGQTLDELVTRLLAQPLSKSDSNFASTFLCLYRKFATPRELLDAFIVRFEELEHDGTQHLIRISNQLRHLGILTLWVLGYPGDFAYPTVRNRLDRFLATLLHHRAFAVAIKEMRLQLEAGVEDDDVGWAKSDDVPDKLAEMEDIFGTLQTNSTSSTLIVHPPGDESPPEHDGADGKIADGTGQKPARISDAPSSSSSGDRSAKWSAGSFQTLLNSVESAEREAQRLVPNPRTLLTKVQWHQFMDLLEEDVAEEMTRIDWIMFSSIRPRDLVRHVSLNASQRAQCKSLENVNRMITHFNHVAYWVSSMIILRDKPKHRARALEKFMGIAWVSFL